MKQRYWLTLLLGVMFFSWQEASACHGVALVNFSASTNGTSVTVNGSSNSATCGCGPYYMEVELACFSSANFTGAAPTCNGTWNVYPWYRSILNVPNYVGPSWPDQCVVEPYFPVTINFAQLCAGTTYVLRARERVCGSGSAGPWSATYTFTTPGVPPNFILNATATPATICAGQQSTLSATVAGSGGCGSGNPVFTWTPISPAGPAIPGNPVNVSPTVTTVYQITAAGGYLTCYGVPPVTVTVTVLPAPIPGTPSAAPTTVCAGQNTTLTLTGYSGTSIQWQSGPSSAGPWTPIPGGTTTPFSTPVVGNTYFNATVSNGCGTVTTTTVLVTVLPAPIISVTPANPAICLGQNIVLTASGGPSYAWAEPPPGGTLSATVGTSVTATPTTTTTYTVTSSQGICTSTFVITVTVNPVPNPVITPANPNICNGDSVQLTCGPGPYSSVTWSPATGLSSSSGAVVDAFPSTTQAYTATATDANGCSDTANITVNVLPNPVLSVTPLNPSVCPGQSVLLTASGAVSYTWNTGATTDTTSVSPVTTTTYTVVGTTGGSCIDSTTVTVTINPNIVVDAGLPDSICPGGQTVLNASPGNASTYTWLGSGVVSGTGTSSPTVAPATTTMYYVDIVDVNGCSGSDSVEVFVRTIPPANAGADVAICTGSSTQLAASGGLIYNWSPATGLSGTNINNPFAAPTQTQTYVVTVTDAFQCSNTDSLVVTVNALPAVNAGPDVFICGPGAQLNASGAANYSWSPVTGLSASNIANPVASPAVTTTYVVTGIDVNGCVNTDTVVVNVYTPLTVVASNAASICPNGSTPLNAAAGGGDGNYIYTWTPATGLSNPNSASPNASPATTTTYTITITDACGSASAIDSVTVTVFPVPVVTITPDVTSGCVPLCVNFTGNSAPSASVSCSWDFSDGQGSGCNVQHCFTTAGSYTIMLNITDGNGCTGSITMPNLITVHPLPVAGFMASPIETTILSPNITFTPTCQNCDSTVYFMGNPDSIVITNNQFTYTFTDSGTFVITQVVYTQYGCTDQTDIVVIIKPDFIIYVPNAFSPNGDGVNEVFMPVGEGIDPENFNMWIYDRWGNMIYNTNDLYKGWNGKVQGQPEISQIDAYVWKIQCKDRAGNKHTYIGHLSMIK
ncbi:MAG: PKD domain-containing protein [Bacteroidetes bacterium]|nr:MAG: PKD domain-containing protein [Bacteroidota bacterium]